MCRFHLWSLNNSDLSRQDHKTSGVVLWCLAPGRLVLYIGGSPWIAHVPVSLTGAQSDWDLGNLEALSTIKALCCVPQADPELFCGVSVRGCTWSTKVFGWVVCVKWHPHECNECHLSVTLILWLTSVYSPASYFLVLKRLKVITCISNMFFTVSLCHMQGQMILEMLRSKEFKFLNTILAP